MSFAGDAGRTNAAAGADRVSFDELARDGVVAVREDDETVARHLESVTWTNLAIAAAGAAPNVRGPDGREPPGSFCLISD